METTGFRHRPAVGVVATLVIAAALGLGTISAAETIYKSVDAEGRVTYSSEPPAQAVESQPVTLPKAPSEAEHQEAIMREKELQKAADKVTSERAAVGSAKKSAVADADTAVDQAQRRLEKAKEMRDSDWQGKAGGGRRLKESYFERVDKAEEKLRQAEEEAAKTRRDSR